ncbi:hypothetical protein K3U93_02175 [Mycobacterium malmoense]|nr:hypothetical protein K3U93_02175 [Mycobacterium malmoense]UNB94831.1 hypothetical protein H5T25_02180 [Mycobacterium malmoense]
MSRTSTPVGQHDHFVDVMGDQQHTEAVHAVEIEQRRRLGSNVMADQLS